MGIEIINIKRRPSSGGGKANGVTNRPAANVHTVRAEDLRVHKPIPNEDGLSMVLKLM